MLVRRWAPPPLEEELERRCGTCPLLRARRLLCQILFPCTHLSSVHASHISQLLQLALCSTPEGPFMQCKCQRQPTEEGSDPSAAARSTCAQRDTKISSCRLPRPPSPSPSLWFIFVFPLPALPVLPVSRHGTTHDSGDYPRLHSNRRVQHQRIVGSLTPCCQSCGQHADLYLASNQPIKVPSGLSFLLWGGARHSTVQLWAGGSALMSGVLILSSLC